MSARQTTSVLNILARGPVAAHELVHALDIHQSTLSRTLQPLERAGEWCV
jgi:DNA-binding IclR family transcriptional regulator